jgi:uncharacterized membrane protein YeaQ/YmgE (transglycosylase-associated protein family)
MYRRIGALVVIGIIAGAVIALIGRSLSPRLGPASLSLMPAVVGAVVGVVAGHATRRRGGRNKPRPLPHA